MTLRPHQIRSRHTLPMIISIMSLAACADNLSGPNECIFAYSIDPGPITVQLGDSSAVRAIPDSNCGAPQSVTWRIEDTSKATVRSTGGLTAMVYGVAKGSTVLNAENGDKSGFALIQVN